ncbi:Cell division control, partial [Perilla frutescens var. hirtella]
MTHRQPARQPTLSQLTTVIRDLEELCQTPDVRNYSSSLRAFAIELQCKVRINHIAAALSKVYKSPVVDTILSLPQHQQ